MKVVPIRLYLYIEGFQKHWSKAEKVAYEQNKAYFHRIIQQSTFKFD
jgi:hypothetical protein